MSGKIFGIGVGPGNPALLTVRAVQVLRRVAAIMAPTSESHGTSLALKIVHSYLRADCQVHQVHFPMTAERDACQAAWDSAAATLLRLASADVSVAFVTVGDALLYSTWAYVLAALRRAKADVYLETVPGVTAMSACAATTSWSLAQGSEPLLIWPDKPPEDVGKLLEIAPSMVFMKADHHLSSLADMVERADAQAVAVRRASQPEAEMTTDLRAWSGTRDYFTTVLLRRRPQQAAQDRTDTASGGPEQAFVERAGER